MLNFKQIVTKTVQVLCHCVGRQINLACEVRKIKLPVSFTLAQKSRQEENNNRIIRTTIARKQ
jgi:hypothetical protein